MAHAIAPFKSDGQTVYLNAKEIEFLRLVCTDRTYWQIARIMGKSPRTIDGYRDNIFAKLELHTRTGLILWSFKTGLMQVRKIELNTKGKRKRKKNPARWGRVEE